MADVTVTRIADGDPMRFDVAVHEGDATTEHAVSVSEADLERLGAGRSMSEADLERLGAGRSPEAFVRDCFAFLLERESKESILRAFDASAIGRYFPEFEDEIAER